MQYEKHYFNKVVHYFGERIELLGNFIRWLKLYRRVEGDLLIWMVSEYFCNL